MAAACGCVSAAWAFYQKLGFTPFDAAAHNWLMMKNSETKMGLFQGMFAHNILTRNPSDVRAIQKKLKAEGIKLRLEADETRSGPAHTTLTDPDGNPILLNQF
ncbi:MAG: VOC family protein [Chloroflexi bacterium]|nr:VOC family protein [Chloroflexota bacterium]